MYWPLGDSAGARKICPPLRRSVRSGCENVRGRSRCATGGRYRWRIANRHSLSRSSNDMPVSRENAAGTPNAAASLRIAPITSSPHRWPMYAQNDSP